MSSSLSKAVLLALLVSAALLSSAPVVHSQTVAFTQLTVPWAPRILQGWAWITQSISYTTPSGTAGTAPAGSVVTWGGGDVLSYNDVYVSTNSGQSWTLIGGIGVSGPNSTVQTFTQSAAANSSFVQDDPGACKAYDPAANVFYVLDEQYAWKSTDAQHWVPANQTVNEYVYRQSAECFIASSNLYILGGQSAGSAYENDVWMSTNQGASFTQQTAAAPWTQRDSMRGFALSTQAGVQAVYMIGGHAKVINYRSSEVWLSSNSGSSWALLQNGPFIGRDHFATVVTSNNIIVLMGGKQQLTSVGGNHLGMNDVWASLDGGYTWGFCGYASWPVRQDMTASIDSNGLIYVSGGTSYPVGSTTAYAQLADAWVSTASFSNPNTVSTSCTIGGAPLPIPATLGLQTVPAVLSSNPYTTNYLGVTTVTVNKTTNICLGNHAAHNTAAGSAAVMIVLAAAALISLLL